MALESFLSYGSVLWPHAVLFFVCGKFAFFLSPFGSVLRIQLLDIFGALFKIFCGYFYTRLVHVTDLPPFAVLPGFGLAILSTCFKVR
jgi:hypothetical protein